MYKFFCLMAELYNDGTVKAAIKTKKSRGLPKDSFRHGSYMDAFNIWYVSEIEAENALQEVRA